MPTVVPHISNMNNLFEIIPPVQHILASLLPSSQGKVAPGNLIVWACIIASTCILVIYLISTNSWYWIPKFVLFPLV
ncbi:hypothetical protein C5167_001715 [Papaver somniferum]|uniref:Uncharacterized protein n=1 Tax=Papaver somniferum TaxID=3469 RepID=A0A4Y7KZ28_PAPSO|nr:hypothetical protein C5167_001715 [Papaver somniferum]